MTYQPSIPLALAVCLFFLFASCAQGMIRNRWRRMLLAYALANSSQDRAAARQRCIRCSLARLCLLWEILGLSLLRRLLIASPETWRISRVPGSSSTSELLASRSLSAAAAPATTLSSLCTKAAAALPCRALPPMTTVPLHAPQTTHVIPLVLSGRMWSSAPRLVSTGCS